MNKSPAMECWELAEPADLCEDVVDAARVREEHMAQVGVLGEKKYGRLLGKYRPRILQNNEEFDGLAAELEALDAIEEGGKLDAEERELQALLAHLCTEYEDRTVQPPTSTLVEVVRVLMEQNGLRPVDLLDVSGLPAVATQVLSGKRGISKGHARRFAERFRLSVGAFI